MTQLKYTGDQTNLSEPYIPSDRLKEAVNVTIALERPLLLKGEPGCGKTRLARAVAEELKLPYFEWLVKSTSRARDGLYTYDTVSRLRDAQLAATEFITDEQRAKFSEREAYVNWGPLGEAFRSKKRAVVLIDEIDKADIDFPNDLLHELDQQEFKVEEAVPPLEVKARHRPIIFITSNDEKELPDAFLRRCLFYYIKFPGQKRLKEIVSRHVVLELEDMLLKQAVDGFWQLREKMVEDKRHGGKKVSTSELIDWVKMLKLRYHDAGEPLPDLTVELLFPSVLLKSRADFTRYSGDDDDTSGGTGHGAV